MQYLCIFIFVFNSATVTNKGVASKMINPHRKQQKGGEKEKQERLSKSDTEP